MQRDRLLYVDLGATKARIAQGEGGEGGRRILCSLEVPVAGQSSFSALLKRAEGSGALSFPLCEVTRCAVGSAGVLVGNVYHQNNFPCPWDIGEAENEFGWPKPALLLNDTEAQAWCLFDDQCIASARTVVAVPESEVNRNGGAAILAVGTGLGRAGWTREGFRTRHKAGLVRSEHGSVGPSVVNADRQMEFLRFLQTGWGEKEMRIESIVAGPGISVCYAFDLTASGEHRWVWSREEKDALKPEAIVDRFRERAFARATWLYYLGLAIRNAMMDFWATQGVYLFGGVLLKNQDLLFEPDGRPHHALLAGMYDNNIIADDVRKVAVSLITDEEASVKGLSLALANDE